MWRPEHAPRYGWYCCKGDHGPDDCDEDVESKNCWPLGLHFVNQGTAVTMCDVFNTRDYGRTDSQ